MNPLNTARVSTVRQHEWKMLPKLSRLYQSIETQKAQMLARLETLSGEKQRSSPSPAEWSPLQVMDHVVLVEEWISGPNAAALPANARVLLKGHLFLAFGGGIMRSGLRVPTLPTAKPQENLDFAAIKQRWDFARASLVPMLSAETRETRHSPIALHPVAGPLNAGQVLRLLDIHLAYHLRHFPRPRSRAGIPTPPAE